MKVKDFDYDLPKELIAQEPASPRSFSRLMVVSKKGNSRNIDVQDIHIEHRKFYDIIDYLKKGDLLILNKTKVLQAKLKANKITGGKAEIVLFSKPSEKKTVVKNHKQNDKTAKEDDKYVINALVKATKVNIGDLFVFGLDDDFDLKPITFGGIKKGYLTKRIDEFKKKKYTLAEIISKDDDIFNLRFSIPYEEVMEKFGVYPLPPYIKNYTKDMEKYQTVYSSRSKNIDNMSVAAPTSGLHYTKSLLSKIKKKGVKIAYVNLAIGLGTFKSLAEDDVEKNKLHSEMVFIDRKNAELINEHKIKNKNGNIYINGTTALRAVESATDLKGIVHPMYEPTNLFCYPGYKFNFKFDGIITNFHLPKSSLLMLISAYFGKDETFKVYKIAVDKKYRFFSFGDAMFLRK